MIALVAEWLEQCTVQSIGSGWGGFFFDVKQYIKKIYRLSRMFIGYINLKLPCLILKHLTTNCPPIFLCVRITN